MNFVKKHPLLTAFFNSVFHMYNHLYRKWCISIWRLLPFAYGFVSPVSAFL